MRGGEDGARDHNGELLPVLSASATKMNYEKIGKYPVAKIQQKLPRISIFLWNWAIFALEGLGKTNSVQWK